MLDTKGINMQTVPRVAIVMGSDSDWPIMKQAAQMLADLGVPYTAKVVSAHRTPDAMFEFAENAEKLGYQVIIAGAGGAAHLPGMIAAKTTLPVLGVPVPSKHLQGQDS
jgi:5-(carboxyamino)imidazole ribonucleotide mutase